MAVARRVEADLLGPGDVPTPALVAGRRREWGRVVDPGRLLGEEDLRSVLVGPGIPDPDVEVVDDAADPLVVIVPTTPGGGGLVFMPARRPVPVMTALALALAAIGGGGRFDRIGPHGVPV